MFTGIVREVGRVVRVEGDDEGLTLQVEAPRTADGLAVGDSVSVAGVCLTAEAVDDGAIRFHAVPETLARTTLARLAPGDPVNVEPALRAGEPLGGHIVQGHVDDLGTVASLEREGDGARLEIGAAESIVRYCVEKGSITVDGVSLTVAAVDGDTFSIALVPHTLAATTLGRLEPGEPVNLEVDVLAKYVERLLDRR
ncbi:MAG TPA: riboflavin synthase [Gaiella sp.]